MAKLFRAAIMGPPGSGKGTISKRIAQSFGLQYLSSGHFLREGIAAKTEAGLLVKTYVDRSMLVPDHVMTSLMLPRLKQLSNHSWLLDGFPRTLEQALALNSLYQLDLVISLNIPYETLKERLSDRWIHPASGRVYNMGFNPPRLQGKDDITGEPLIQHDDDKPEALMARLRQYKEVAKPVIDLYKSQGILHPFSGTDTDRIWPYINSLLSTKMDIQPSDACQPQTP
ncbi:adenylate kinase 4, mitochondrial isoform X1 [Archocentrus centrarchus]|uniref:adenylate kinase 4, mitochondrial isoform X1 n=1 Tax=Archocentrus centrarchus TaxID=63155 RepID=UPI0011EA18D4|nr:adenylate kinase 4, mitochondrial isoform X1 [Archocentrus centrarchus]